jgi:HEAT repeat protein
MTVLRIVQSLILISLGLLFPLHGVTKVEKPDPEEILRHLDQVKASNPKMIYWIGILKLKPAVPHLCQLLETSKRYEKEIVSALGRIGDPIAVLPIVRHVKKCCRSRDDVEAALPHARSVLQQIDSQWTAHLEIQQVLASSIRDNDLIFVSFISPQDAVPMCMETIRRNKEETAVVALRILKREKVPCAFIPVLDALYTQLNAQDGPDNFEEYVAALDGIDPQWRSKGGARRRFRECYSGLREVMKKSDLKIYEVDEKIQCLLKIDRQRALPLLLTEIRRSRDLEDIFDCSPQLPPAAFGVIRESTVRRALLRRLADSDPEIRVQAARLLGKAGAEEAIPSLCSLTEDANIEVKIASLQALAGLGCREVFPLIVRTLNAIIQSDSDNGHLIPVLIESLARLHEDRVVPELLKMLKNEDDYSSWEDEIVEALGRTGDKRVSAVLVPFLLERLDDESGSTSYPADEEGFIISGTIETLLGLKDPRILPAMKKLLDHPLPRVRAYAAWAVYCLER